MKKPNLDLSPGKIFFILVCICFALMVGTYFRSETAIPVRTAIGAVIVPLQRGTNKIGLKLFDLSEKHKTMEQLTAENESLSAENEFLRQQLALTENNTKELNRINDLLEMKESLEQYETTGARIISRDSENWYAKFNIDKGINDGIRENMVVVNGEGLVGIVTAVGPNYATVTSIIDDAMNVSAMSVTTKANCIVRGDTKSLNDGVIQIRYLNKQDQINEGDTIVTSNISDYYLPGILIGYATNLKMDNNELTQSGNLVPAVDFSNLNEVLVILTLKETGK